MNNISKTRAAPMSYREMVAAHNTGLTGRGITIAVLDTGISSVQDLVKPDNRILAFCDFVNHRNLPYDDNGHGTHVAGVAAGNGFLSDGKYRGIAPEASIVSIKILDKNGKGSSTGVLEGIKWIIEHKEKYNIRVANLSIGTNDEGSADPLVKAVEAAWDAGIVMTIAAGNNGPSDGSVTSPGISRKVVTVGASDESGVFLPHPRFNLAERTPQASQQTIPVYFSGRGPTSECIIKPDIIAPGADIISCAAKNDGARFINFIRDSKHYAKMSGTSMATPIVSGAIALLLQKNPNLLPDEIKLALKKCAVSLNFPRNRQGWGLLNVENLLNLF